jgi:hypothetical protein
LVVRNDVVRGAFGRLGMVGAILVASALIYGAIAGGVLIHRLESPPVASSTQEQGNNADEQGDNADSQGHGQSKNKAPKHAHPSPEPDDPEDKDT